MNKIAKLTLYVVICLFILSACTYDDMMEKFIPKEEAKMAEDYLTKLRNKDFDYIKSKISDELKPEVTDALLVELAGYFRDGDLISTEIIGSQVNIFNGIWQGNFTFEYHFSDGWNLANVAFRKTGDTYEVIGLNVYKSEMSQREFHAFTLSNKSFLHYIILVTVILVPLFIVISTYFCVRTPIPKRKWLWVIFVLVGIGAVQINWTTGQYGFQPISIHLLGAAAQASGPHAPWIITVAFPLGAILFWFKRRKFIVHSEEANQSQQQTAESDG